MLCLGICASQHMICDMRVKASCCLHAIHRVSYEELRTVAGLASF